MVCEIFRGEAREFRFFFFKTTLPRESSTGWISSHGKKVRRHRRAKQRQDVFVDHLLDMHPAGNPQEPYVYACDDVVWFFLYRDVVYPYHFVPFYINNLLIHKVRVEGELIVFHDSALVFERDDDCAVYGLCI